jgi:hypothetical protein
MCSGNQQKQSKKNLSRDLTIDGHGIPPRV